MYSVGRMNNIGMLILDVHCQLCNVHLLASDRSNTDTYVQKKFRKKLFEETKHVQYFSSCHDPRQELNDAFRQV